MTTVLAYKLLCCINSQIKDSFLHVHQLLHSVVEPELAGAGFLAGA